MLRAVGRLQHGGKFGEVEIAAAGAADFAAEVGEGFEAEAGDAAGFDGGFYDVARADGVAGAGGERAVGVGRANAFFVLGDGRDLLGREQGPAFDGARERGFPRGAWRADERGDVVA